ncbi:hypothetical protein L798_08110 [Zootermopsis nevadensis]|uniref:Uncharacterized protein n=1 Tax=Zootermopsis nevadensis TaxID=136037 RepID=A0A067R245_ZOONE|nr:hypothetical protein L798_08110 [Zootermopsis nevadensis]
MAVMECKCNIKSIPVSYNTRNFVWCIPCSPGAIHDKRWVRDNGLQVLAIAKFHKDKTIFPPCRYHM